MKKIIIPYDILYDLYINNNYTMDETAKTLGVSRDTIKRNLKEYSIESHKTGSWIINERINLTTTQIEIINGALLGDGGLYKPKAGNAQFTYTSKIYNHVLFVYDFIKEYITNEDIKEYTYYDRRTNKKYTRYIIRTLLNEYFTELYKKWHQDKKIIPNDLILTPLTCLIWYIGDGCLSNSHYSQFIKLATHCFSLEDIEKILIPQLSRFQAKPMKTDNNQYFIYIPHNNIKEFLSYIGECPFDEYKYKWQYREYKNSMPKSHADKEEQFVILYQQGWTYYKIAKYFDIEPNAVKYYLIKNKIYNKGVEKHNA